MKIAGRWRGRYFILATRAKLPGKWRIQYRFSLLLHDNILLSQVAPVVKIDNHGKVLDAFPAGRHHRPKKTWRIGGTAVGLGVFAARRPWWYKGVSVKEVDGNEVKI